MTSTNHVTTGAVIALAVKQPQLAIPLAFASHFVMDAIPHFGIYEDDVLRRNKSRVFRTAVSIDVPVAIGLVFLLPHLAASHVAWWIVFTSMVAAVAPDFQWIHRFIREVRTKQWSPGGRFTQFHQGIQWFEHPVGIIPELIWLGTMSLLFEKLVT